MSKLMLYPQLWDSHVHVWLIHPHHGIESYPALGHTGQYCMHDSRQGLVSEPLASFLGCQEFVGEVVVVCDGLVGRSLSYEEVGDEREEGGRLVHDEQE